MVLLSVQFIRKTFFSLAFCECCRRLLFTGLYCNQCNFRFHQRCGDKVPPLCHQINMDRYYQQLLAHNPESSAGILNPGSGYGYPRYVHKYTQSGWVERLRFISHFFFFSCFSHPRTLNSQDRSNSAPNVNINNVKPIGDPRLLLPKGALVCFQFFPLCFY